ncbi:hypothetical protein M9458_019757, partial [Cirrhinus mrigala]
LLFYFAVLLVCPPVRRDTEYSLPLCLFCFSPSSALSCPVQQAEILVCYLILLDLCSACESTCVEWLSPVYL